MRRVLVLDSDEARRGAVESRLKATGIEAVSAAAPDGTRPDQYDAVFCDVTLVDRLHPVWDQALVVVTGGPEDLDRALAAARFERRRRRRTESDVTEGESPASDVPKLIGRSAAAEVVRQTITRVAAHRTTVLIYGESGTGKEVVARQIHHQSRRSGRPFIAVNCGAIPANLLESELFGHARGAFTGAVRDKLGLFELAEGGTLLLDEIGELPPELQVKLLRVLQENEIRRVGETRTRRTNARVIASTVRVLEEDVAAGRFRRDLYYRLNVLPIEMPSLRERAEDIEELAVHFVERFAVRHGRTQRPQLTASALALLRTHSWPGNIRELENTIERAVVLCEGAEIGPDYFRSRLMDRKPSRSPGKGGEALSIKKATRALERELIRRALATTRGNRTNAAKLLEISHRALLYKIKEYGL